MRLSKIRDDIGRGDYRVDTQAVADAIIRRLTMAQPVAVAGPPSPQSECS